MEYLWLPVINQHSTMEGDSMLTVLYYLVVVLVDGDTANDWLTHMSPVVADIMFGIGEALVMVMGMVM